MSFLITTIRAARAHTHTHPGIPHPITYVHPPADSTAIEFTRSCRQPPQLPISVQNRTHIRTYISHSVLRKSFHCIVVPSVTAECVRPLEFPSHVPINHHDTHDTLRILTEYLQPSSRQQGRGRCGQVPASTAPSSSSRMPLSVWIVKGFAMNRSAPAARAAPLAVRSLLALMAMIF